MKSILLRIALFGILLVGMSAFSSQGQLKAQSTFNQDIYALPVGNFVNATIAKQRLDNKVTNLKYQLEGLIQGTSQYQAVWAQYTYYNTILNSVNAGKTIPQSIVDGLTTISVDEFALAKNVLSQYRTEAINLLKA